MYDKRILFKLICLTALLTFSLQAQQPPASADRWDSEIRKFEEADRRHAPVRGGVLFIGSSSIRMWRTLPEDFPQVRIINRGFGGSEIHDATRYVDRIVVPYRPKMVVLYAGDNDLAAGKRPPQVFADYLAFVRRVHQKLPTTRIAFISIKPSLARASLMPQMKEVNAMIKDHARRDKKLIYIDVFTPMLRDDGTPRPELFIADGLHMNEEGYRLWKSIVAPHIR